MEFEKKLQSLFGNNTFVKTGLEVSSETTSSEGGKKYSTTGDLFVDDFAAISRYKKPRSYQEVAQDMYTLWSVDPLLTMKLLLYVRLVTRKTVLDNNTLSKQKGQGLKHEGIMRMLWVAVHHPNTFKLNLPLFIAAGSWKDVIQMMSFDLQYHGFKGRKLDWNFLSQVISAGLSNDLVRKYLPTIKTNKKCTTLESQADTLIGRYLARKFFPNYPKEISFKKYRELKSHGTAHQWQQLISKQLYDEINFNTIAGRALSLLVNSKFLENHKLANKYSDWVLSQPTVKFTGYVHELFKSVDYDIKPWVKETVNRQFQQLLEESTQSSLLVVRDTSGSMGGQVIRCNMSSGNIAKALALYFSYFLKGAFANTFGEFNKRCKLHQWIGETPVDKYLNDKCSCIGNTNFQSVIDLFIELKDKGVPESDFPSGILCISDGEFQQAAHHDLVQDGSNQTNFKVAIKRLREANFSSSFVDNFKIILWDIPNQFYGNKEVKFESFADCPNLFQLSGYDGSVISFILGKEYSAPKTEKELFLAAMNQELLNLVKIT